MWGFEADGVVPDIVVMAKGIGNGFPLGAVVAKKAIGDVMADKFMFHTYGANPTSCAAGRAVLQVIREEKTQENARIVGGALLARLKDLQQNAIDGVKVRGWVASRSGRQRGYRCSCWQPRRGKTFWMFGIAGWLRSIPPPLPPLAPL
jgi:4-aminobutyrate aminotransferase-like enzyme